MSEHTESRSSTCAETDYRGPDRRRTTLKSLIHGMFNPRRRRVRRDTDEANAFVDWHPRHLLVVAAIILGLSTLDGILTVHLMNIGAAEMNPLLASLVERDASQFAIIKWLLTACGVVALVITERACLFGRLRSRSILYGVLVGYVVLVLYSLSLAVLTV